MENNCSNTGDTTLDSISERITQITIDLIGLYDLIRYAKDHSYSYNELGIVTGFPRGTLQNIAAGQNPRFTVEKEK